MRVEVLIKVKHGYKWIEWDGKGRMEQRGQQKAVVGPAEDVMVSGNTLGKPYQWAISGETAEGHADTIYEAKRQVEIRLKERNIEVIR